MIGLFISVSGAEVMSIDVLMQSEVKGSCLSEPVALAEKTKQPNKKGRD